MHGKEWNKLNIKSWAEEDRPREKLLLKGRSALSDAELVALLIGSGNKDETAVELAKRILCSVNNNLNELGKLSSEQLTEFHGIGKAKAISIVASLELGRRRKTAEVLKRTKIASSMEVFQMMHPLLEDLDHEEFWIILLNRANFVISRYHVSKGGVSGTIADVKIIFKKALESLASSVILCHNHPSGNCQPSEADVRLTAKMKKSGDIMDIAVLDHLIIAGNEYFSFADEGYL